MTDQKGVCRLGIVPLRAEPAHKSEMVNQLLFGEHYTVLDHTTNFEWLFIENFFDKYKGWIHSNQHHQISDDYFEQINNSNYKISLDPISSILYNRHPLFIPMGSILPITANELFKMEEQLAFNGDAKDLGQKRDYDFVRSIALKYLHTPYLWGGKTPFGIDCSGFVQQVFKIGGYVFPRDTGEQILIGEEVLEDILPGDVAFFTDPGKKKVSHVGIVLEDMQIIHSSGQVRIDTLQKEGIEHAETKSTTHELLSVRRVFVSS
jgi:hypothetical protein